MEREVGGGIGMGKTCKPKAISFQCMTKFTTKKKKRTPHGVTFYSSSSKLTHKAYWENVKKFILDSKL